MRFALPDVPFSLVSRNRRRLPFPSTTRLRIAQVTASSKPFYSAKVFAPKVWDRLGRFRPQVLIGALADIQRISQHANLLGFDPTNIDQAIVVLTSCLEQPLSDVTRVVLWQTFGVPIYEAIVASQGVIVAAECMAHEGWHLEPGVTASFKGSEIAFHIRGKRVVGASFGAELTANPCPCGRSGLRLTNVVAQEALDQPVLAAIA